MGYLPLGKKQYYPRSGSVCGWRGPGRYDDGDDQTQRACVSLVISRKLFVVVAAAVLLQPGLSQARGTFKQRALQQACVAYSGTLSHNLPLLAPGFG